MIPFACEIPFPFFDEASQGKAGIRLGGVEVLALTMKFDNEQLTTDDGRWTRTTNNCNKVALRLTTQPQTTASDRICNPTNKQTISHILKIHGSIKTYDGIYIGNSPK